MVAKICCCGLRGREKQLADGKDKDKNIKNNVNNPPTTSEEENTLGQKVERPSRSRKPKQRNKTKSEDLSHLNNGKHSNANGYHLTESNNFADNNNKNRWSFDSFSTVSTVQQQCPVHNPANQQHRSYEDAYEADLEGIITSLDGAGTPNTFDPTFEFDDSHDTLKSTSTTATTTARITPPTSFATDNHNHNPNHKQGDIDCTDEVAIESFEKKLNPNVIRRDEHDDDDEDESEITDLTSQGRKSTPCVSSVEGDRSIIMPAPSLLNPFPSLKGGGDNPPSNRDKSNSSRRSSDRSRSASSSHRSSSSHKVTFIDQSPEVHEIPAKPKRSKPSDTNKTSALKQSSLKTASNSSSAADKKRAANSNDQRAVVIEELEPPKRAYDTTETRQKESMPVVISEVGDDVTDTVEEERAESLDLSQRGSMVSFEDLRNSYRNSQYENEMRQLQQAQLHQQIQEHQQMKQQQQLTQQQQIQQRSTSVQHGRTSDLEALDKVSPNKPGTKFQHQTQQQLIQEQSTGVQHVRTSDLEALDKLKSFY